MSLHGYTLFVLFLLKNLDCEYSLEPPRQGGSNEYPQSMFWAEIWKNIKSFSSENFQFLEVKISIYLNRRVLVMPLQNAAKIFSWSIPSLQSRWTSECSASILYKSIAGRYQPVRVADGPITARYRFIKNAYWVLGKNRKISKPRQNKCFVTLENSNLDWNFIFGTLLSKTEY